MTQLIPINTGLGVVSVAKTLKTWSPVYVAMVMPLGWWVCVPGLRAAAKVRTTRRLNITEITRNLQRHEDKEEQSGDPWAVFALVSYNS